MSYPEALEQVGAVAPGGEPDVPGDGEVREQPVILWQVSDAASLGAEVEALRDVEPDLVAERNAPRARALEAGDRSQKRGLAGARRTNKRDRLGGSEVQRDANIERPPREGDVDDEGVHERANSLAVSRMAALTIISRTPIAIAWSRFASNSE